MRGRRCCSQDLRLLEGKPGPGRLRSDVLTAAKHDELFAAFHDHCVHVGRGLEVVGHVGWYRFDHLRDLGLKIRNA